jgi:hypothetical protein
MKSAGEKSTVSYDAVHGVVASHLGEHADAGGMALREVPSVMKAVRAGLPFAEVEVLREALDIPLDQLAPVLGVSKATVHRRKLEGRLTPLRIRPCCSLRAAARAGCWSVWWPEAGTRLVRISPIRAGNVDPSGLCRDRSWSA